MRLFTGIALPPRVRDRLALVLEDLRALAALNWSPVENLHITCKFIGEWPENRLPELKEALERKAFPGGFKIAIARFGYFPNPHHPRALFAGVQAGSALGALASAIDGALEPLGIAREDRPYSPHLTLARIKQQDIRELREHIAKMTNFDFGAFDASEFQLYLSKAGPKGSLYTSLATYPLSSVVSAMGSQK
jgi:RNA 2',3'-cyclic 3'-phosphodiesterase